MASAQSASGRASRRVAVRASGDEEKRSPFDKPKPKRIASPRFSEEAQTWALLGGVATMLTILVTLGVAAELHQTYGMDQRPHRVAAAVGGWDHDMTRASLAEVVAREAALASDSVVDDLQAFSACQCRWLLRLSDDDLRRCPEFLLEVCVQCGHAFSFTATTRRWPRVDGVEGSPDAADASLRVTPRRTRARSPAS